MTSLGPAFVSPTRRFLYQNVRFGRHFEGFPSISIHFHPLRFNFWISEYFEVPAPARSLLDALALLMGWQGDAQQVVKRITGQRHSEDRVAPEALKSFLRELQVGF